MTRILMFLALCVAAPAQASPIAEVICGPGPEIRQRLETHHGAELTGTGFRSPEEIMELWSAPTGDWTLVMAYADGRRCIVAMGEAWEPRPQNPA